MTDSLAASIIIPSYRSRATLGACLMALTQQQTQRAYDIIVVDSAPNEAVADIVAQFPRARLLQRTTQTDPALARNLGAREAMGAVLAFIDSDCVAAPDWLERLCQCLENGNDAVGGAIANGNPETLISWAGYVCEFREFLPDGVAHAVDNLTLGNAAYPRALFLKLGGFPEGCFPQEDQVFHRALRAAGGRIWLDPGIIVWHTHRTRMNDFVKHQRFIGTANAKVLRRLNLPGVALARSRVLAGLALPLLIPYRWARTVRAAWPFIAPRPLVMALIAWGMVYWGVGFAGNAGERD